MAAAKKDGFEEIDFSKVKKPFPDDISGFSEQFQEAIINAAGIEKLMDEKLPLDNPDICPIITPAELSRFDPQIGGMRKIQAGGPRRKTKSAPQQRDLGSGSDEEDPDLLSGLDVPSAPGSDQNDSGTELVGQFPPVVQNAVRIKQRALEEIVGIPETDDTQRVQEQADQIGARMGGALGMTPEQEEVFIRRAMKVRDGMIEARGIKKTQEQIRLEEEAEARNERLRQIERKPPSERTPEEESELSEAQRGNRRLEQLQAERREDQYYFVMAAVVHAVGAIYIGMNMYHALVLNSFGDMMRSLMSQANLGMACGATLSSVFYNADCPSVTRMTQIMWGSIFFVIGSGAIYLGIRIEDRTNIFSILAGLTMYSIDSLKSLFKVMGGIQTTIETGVSTSVGFAVSGGQTVGGIILWPLTRVVNVCRRGFGYEPLRKEKEKEKGGRKRRRTMKHKRKTRGKKGKKMRKTKNKRKRGSRKKQRGGNTKLIPMLDGYSSNPSAGGKKRRKGRKGRKTRGKTKRRYGKKRGTRKH